MEGEEIIEQPRKRLKTEDTPQGDDVVFPTSEGAQKQAEASATAQLQPSAEDSQTLKEAEVGITEFVSADLPGFSGILKKRFVHESSLGKWEDANERCVLDIPTSWSTRSCLLGKFYTSETSPLQSLQSRTAKMATLLQLLEIRSRLCNLQKDSRTRINQGMPGLTKSPSFTLRTKTEAFWSRSLARKIRSRSSHCTTASCPRPKLGLANSAE